MTRENHNSAGFSLVELLTVVAIIALLIALLLPALKEAKESARVTRCAANQRQLRSAALAYSIDFGDLIVPYGLSGSNGRYWRFGLDPYLGHKKPPDATKSFDDPVWDCPTHPSEYNAAGVKPYTRWDSRTSYAANTVMVMPSSSSNNRLPTNAMVVRPGDKFLLVEVRTDVSTGSVISNPYMSPVTQGGLASGNGWYGHHTQRTQAAFVDGHVKLLPQTHAGFWSPSGGAKHWGIK